MRVRFRLFMAFREVVGSEEVELSLPDGATVGEALEALKREYPGLAPKLSPGRYILMRGGRWPRDSDPLSDGDVLSLFPPVGGG
ncbi:MAG: molybdopterin synthase sulfur carrier subunit [Thermoproteota archaeon]|nr:MAG: molybdopterin synthase sulfur carrier subunit [Candidatus Korarchaeota archaeon]